jgi:hypothetical protein
MESLVTLGCLPLFLCGVSKKSSSLLMIHVFLICMGRGGGITCVSPHLGLGATRLGRKSTSFKVGCLFWLGMVFPNFKLDLIISVVS